MEQRFTQKLVWNDIKLTVSCMCEWSIIDFCHIEIHCDQRLPITQTGYRSHFMLLKYLEGHEDYLAFVKAWLDEAALSKDWKRHVEDMRQPSLFDFD